MPTLNVCKRFSRSLRVDSCNRACRNCGRPTHSRAATKQRWSVGDQQMLNGKDGQPQSVNRIVGAIVQGNANEDDFARELCGRFFSCKLNHGSNACVKNFSYVAAIAGVA